VKHPTVTRSRQSGDPAGTWELHRAHLYPNEGKATPSVAQREQHERRNLVFAACVRRHGFPQFPDGWSGNVGQLISAGIDPGSPRLNAALTKCGF
jgi:hypothetical protein